jgi:hypothetical protein
MHIVGTQKTYQTHKMASPNKIADHAREDIFTVQKEGIEDRLQHYHREKLKDYVPIYPKDTSREVLIKQLYGE